jgi:hypothetical protein
MKNWLATCLAATTLLVSSVALAAFHLFTIEQVYSNADGTIQFVVVTSPLNGENFWSLGASLSSTDSSGTRKVSFTRDLPSSNTAGKRALIATQSFADLGIVAPDFIIPDHFIATGPGSVTYVSSTLNYPSGLPADGVSALNIAGTPVPNVATNFAGDSASVQPPPVAQNFQGIWWLPTEAGWGINLAHQADTIFASWFTYDTTGKGMWLVMTAPKTGTGTYSGHLLATHGPRFDAFDTTQFKFDDVGIGTLTFTDINNGSFHYVIGAVDQTKTITRQVFGTLPTCSYGTQPNLALATNYQDLWWAKPPGSEAGWGINVNHESDTIFATWFTYDIDGTPMWLVATMMKSAPGVYSGDLLRTHGPRFDAYDTTQFKFDKVGTATLTFADGNNASFEYTVQVAGMAAPVTQTKPITRQLFSALGTTCQ